MTTLSDLLEKVREAKGADRELDLAIGQATGDVPLHWRYSPESKDILSTFDLVRNSECNYTASVDAALALVERVLPGWGVQVGHPLRRSEGGVWREGEDDTGWYACVFRARKDHETDVLAGCYGQSEGGGSLSPSYRYAANGALAILAALLSALIQKEQVDA